MTVLSTHQLTRTYGRRRGIQDVNLQLAAGEIFGFLGPNGAGKSTTIRLLLGFLQPDSGHAKVLDHDCWSQSAKVKQQVGYVAGDVRLYPWLTARRAFSIVEQVRGCRLMDDGLQLAEEFRLEPDLPVRRMSRGNRQKVALVLALVHRPPLIILDEPTSGLDPLMQDVLISRLRQLAAQGHAVFFSSHTLSEVETLCDRVAIVKDGRIVEDTTIRSLQDQAPREVQLHFRSSDDAANVTVPSKLTHISRTENVISGTLNGHAINLMDWASKQDLLDISIERPNLESVFRTYYEQNSGAAK